MKELVQEFLSALGSAYLIFLIFVIFSILFATFLSTAPERRFKRAFGVRAPRTAEERCQVRPIVRRHLRREARQIFGASGEAKQEITASRVRDGIRRSTAQSMLDAARKRRSELENKCDLAERFGIVLPRRIEELAASEG